MSLIKSPGWAAMGLCQTMVEHSVEVSSGSYQGRNRTQHSLFQQRLTNNKSESQQQTPVSKNCNDRGEAQEEIVKQII